MIWRMWKGQMRLLIISPAQVRMDPGSAALWHWEGTDTHFHFVKSAGLESGGCFFVFFFPPGPTPPSIFWSGHSCCKYLREERVTSFPPDLPPHTHTHTYTPPSLFCITLIGAQGMQALPGIPLLFTYVSSSVSVPVSASKSHFPLSVTSPLPSICQFSLELKSA